MTVETSLKKFMQDLKKDPGYKNWLEQFKNWVATKDRTNDYLKYFLIYDIDRRSYMMRSEYNITQNQLVLWEAWLPPKKNPEKSIEFKQHDYRTGELD